MKKIILSVVWFVLVVKAPLSVAQKPNVTAYLFRDSAMAASWCPYDSTLVAYQLKRGNYHEMFLANVGPGNKPVNERCISCNHPLLPGKNTAAPVFDPKGRFILFGAEMANHEGSSGNSIPGIGTYNDLYLMTPDGKKVWKLTSQPDTGLSAIIFASISPSGRQIMWAQMVGPVNPFDGKHLFGDWAIKIGNLIGDTITGFQLANIKTILPGGVMAFNEPYGWSPDESRILFASCFDQFWVWSDQIYTMDTLGNNIKQMTETGGTVGWPYNEHAFYSTDGKYIVWMTNREANTGPYKDGCDWWIMNSDGSNQRRLTYFNDTTSNMWTGSTHINGFGCFSPNPRKFIGDVGPSQPVQIDPEATVKGAVYIIEFNDPLSTGQLVSNLKTAECILYPNPATDYLNVTVPANSDAIGYSVWDVAGHKIEEGKFYSESLMVNIQKYSPGIYFLKISDGIVELNRKFLVSSK